MATAQQQRTRQKSRKVLVQLPNETSSEQESLVVVKRLLAISVSSITYLRGLFPESSYGTRYLDELCLKILREDKNYPGSLQIVQWIQGCFDALEKKYKWLVACRLADQYKETWGEVRVPPQSSGLSQTRPALTSPVAQPGPQLQPEMRPRPWSYLAPQPTTSLPSVPRNGGTQQESVTELYQFKFKYTKEGTKMNLSSNGANVDGVLKIEDLKEAGILLLRKLYILMQNLGPLPNDVTLTMKLYYYSDITPYNYQPPGFKEGLSPDSMIFQGNPVNLKIGSVSTGFHILKVKVTTDRERTASMGEKLVKRSRTEISHQGLDFDDDNEEEHCIMENGSLSVFSQEILNLPTNDITHCEDKNMGKNDSPQETVNFNELKKRVYCIDITSGSPAASSPTRTPSGAENQSSSGSTDNLAGSGVVDVIICR
ncbi:HORMA domain-containing protein 2 [Discoglossus pictus]